MPFLKELGAGSCGRRKRRKVERRRTDLIVQGSSTNITLQDLAVEEDVSEDDGRSLSRMSSALDPVL